MKFFKIVFFIGIGAFLFTASNTLAASFYIVPAGQNFSVGQEFNADLFIDSEGVPINAAQAILNFSSSVLRAVSVDNSNSVFNFWVEDPTIVNGAVSFIGGTSKDANDKALRIFRIKFKAIGSGTADITINDGVITASDGKGTNVLSVVKGAKILVSPSSVNPQEPARVVEEAVQKIVREPVKVSKLPALPKVRVPLYPDSEKWYNYSGSFAAFWDIPDDVIKIATFIDQSPKTIPIRFDTELFNGEKIGPLKEGVWYLHVRFQNNIGAGSTNHYRIAIDLTPPLPFLVQASEGLKIADQDNYVKTDNPQVTLRFAAKDGFSGLSHYNLTIDGQAPVRLDIGEYKLPLQSPGNKAIAVQAVDNAGNIQEQILNVEILPLPSPVITYVKPDIFVGEGNLLVRGTADSNFIVKVSVKKKSGESVFEFPAVVDKDGNWEAVLDHPLKRGYHFIEAIAQDQRGALSLPAVSEFFKVKDKPLFSIGGLGITQSWFFIGLIILLVSGFFFGFFSHHFWRQQLHRKITVAERDVSTVFSLISKDVDRMLQYYGDQRIDEREAAEMEALLKKLKNDLERMKKYVSSNLEELAD